MTPSLPGDRAPSEITEALLRAAREGCGESFGGLWARVAPALFVWAEVRIRAPLRPRLEPEDLVQEVCCRAYRDFARFDPERGAFRGWVFGIANNVLKRALREWHRAPAARPSGLDDSSALLGDLPDDATSVSRRVARDEQLRALIERVAQLPEQDRGLVLFRGLEGLAHADVAERMGLELEVVKKRWQRLLGRLRDEGESGALFAPGD